MVQTLFIRPKQRPYKTDNYYAALKRQAKAEKEVERIVRISSEREQKSPNGVIIMGNEGNGIGTETGKSVNRRLYIPNWPAGAATSESLNVAIATAIVCSEFRRRLF